MAKYPEIQGNVRPCGAQAAAGFWRSIKCPFQRHTMLLPSPVWRLIPRKLSVSVWASPGALDAWNWFFENVTDIEKKLDNLDQTCIWSYCNLWVQNCSWIPTKNCLCVVLWKKTWLFFCYFHQWIEIIDFFPLLVPFTLTEKVQAEIDQVIGQSRQPTMADRADMPYTDAVIHEIQRIGNIAPLGLPRYTTKDVQLGDYLIPKVNLPTPLYRTSYNSRQ